MKLRTWAPCMVLVWLVGISTAASAKVSVGERAAELLSVQRTNGEPITLRQFRGKVVVLTFGASWCKPCKKELPAYEKLGRKFAQAGAEVAIVAVNIDSNRGNAERFIKAAGVKTVLVGLDPKAKTADKYEPPTMPTTYVIDKRGIVRYVHHGYRAGDESSIEAHVNALLK